MKTTNRSKCKIIFSKLLAALLSLMLVTVFLTSCGLNEKVEITSDNFSDYFSVNVYAEDLKVGEVILAYKATCTLHIEITPLVNLKTENLIVSIELDNNWKVDGNSVIEIRIPENGEATKIVAASSTSMWNYGSNYPTPNSKIVNATGDIYK